MPSITYRPAASVVAPYAPSARRPFQRRTRIRALRTGSPVCALYTRPSMVAVGGAWAYSAGRSKKASFGIRGIRLSLVRGHDQLRVLRQLVAFADHDRLACVLERLEEFGIGPGVVLHLVPREQLVVTGGDAFDGETPVHIGDGALEETVGIALVGDQNHGGARRRRLLFQHLAVDLTRLPGDDNIQFAGGAAAEVNDSIGDLTLPETNRFDVPVCRQAGHGQAITPRLYGVDPKGAILLNLGGTAEEHARLWHERTQGHTKAEMARIQPLRAHGSGDAGESSERENDASGIGLANIDAGNRSQIRLLRAGLGHQQIRSGHNIREGEVAARIGELPPADSPAEPFRAVQGSERDHGAAAGGQVGDFPLDADRVDAGKAEIDPVRFRASRNGDFGCTGELSRRIWIINGHIAAFI